MVDLNNKFEPHSCAKCGKLHTCTGNYNCWCVSIEIPEQIQDYIMACYDGCLCKACIKELLETYKNQSQNSIP